MERKIQIKVEAGAEYIGIDIIPELLANKFYPLSTDDDMASTHCQSAKSVYKRELIGLVESKELIPIDPLFLIPYDPRINGIVIWDYMSHLLVSINEFIRVCNSWGIEVVIEIIHNEQKSEPQDADDKQDNEQTQYRTGVYGLRDKDAALWLKENTEQISNGKTTIAIAMMGHKARLAALIGRDSDLWSEGYMDWSRKQTILPKAPRGKPYTNKPRIPFGN